MMTYTMQEADLLSDERLVGLTLGGDRDAFGQIVARYQAAICALAYSACGSITRSEDLAQEVFVAAWRRLRELRDPAKLKSWLYSIARNQINSAFRQQLRNPLAAASPLSDAEMGDEFCAPSDTTMSKEEEAILWHVLSGLPEVYREPMVLFYRQEESMASVAEILGISEEAVRQRLSRGRAMLNERVAKVVEIGLRRSGPSKAFSMAVLAALPPATLKAGTVGAGTAAVKALSTFAGVGLAILSITASIVSAAGSVVGGMIGLWGRVQNTRSLRERRFAARTVWGTLAFAVTFLMIERLLVARGVLRISADPANVITLTVCWLAFLGPLFFFAISRSRQQRRIQAAEGTDPERAGWWMWHLDPTRPGFKKATHGMLAAQVFGAGGWIMLKAIALNDVIVLGSMLGLCIAGWAAGAAAVARRPQKTPSIFAAVWWALAVVNLAVVNLRWDSWFAANPAPGLSNHLAPWTADYLVVFFFAIASLGWWLRRVFVNLPDARRAARVAVTIYFALLLCGVSVLLLGK